MKLRLPETVIRLNVEHRTSNIERRILMTLRFIYFKTSEPQNPPKADKSRRMVSLTAFVAASAEQACSIFFIKKIEYIPSIFDIRFFLSYETTLPKFLL